MQLDPSLQCQLWLGRDAACYLLWVGAETAAVTAFSALESETTKIANPFKHQRLHPCLKIKTKSFQTLPE